MLVTLLAWICVTLICYAWGMLLLQRIKIILKDDSFLFPHFSFICLAGLSAVTVFAGILSLFMAIGGWQAQLIVISPCIVLFFQKQKLHFPSLLKKQFTGLHPAVLFLLISCLVMILVLSTWTINHPDTLGYHAQTIQWIEKYKAIPGLVHLHTRYGYQGLWFVASAFFSFKFTGIEALTFINSSVIAWYFFFIIYKINKCLTVPADRINGILWLLLFAASLVSYTQVRLTASSGSPDFIAALYVWAVFYLLSKKEAGQSVVHWILIIVLSIFSITVKLAVAPVFIIAGYSAIQLLRLKKIKPLIFSCILTLFIFLPFFARNIITSGYMVFPSPIPDFINVDWKFNKGATGLEKDYITAYARTHVDYNKEEIEAVMKMNPGEWLPLWWVNNSAADKTILIILVILLVTSVFQLKTIARSNSYTKMGLLTAIAGIVFWFIEAPDPRFGFGFLVPFSGLLLYLLLNKGGVSFIKKQWLSYGLVLFSAVTLLYTSYRCMYFFNAGNILAPAGVLPVSYKTLECNGVKINVPSVDQDCGDTPVPCTAIPCNNFTPIGTHIRDGFKAK